AQIAAKVRVILHHEHGGRRLVSLLGRHRLIGALVHPGEWFCRLRIRISVGENIGHECIGWMGGGIEGKSDRYSGTEARFALRRACQVVEGHVSLYERESDAYPLVVARGARVGVVESFEDVRELLRRDPPSGVTHLNHGLAARPPESNADAAARRREVECIS